MLRILLPPAVCVASAAFAGLAFGQITGEGGAPPPARQTAKIVKQTVAPRKVLPPLVLPNIGRELHRLNNANRPVQVRQMVASGNVLRFWSHHRWVLATRHEKCWEVPWQRSCTAARASVRLHRALSARAEWLVERSFPVTNDWLTAVRLAQRVYPGTEGWLRFISDREGGWGGFVMNHQGSGAGGWLQFMASTFYAYVGDAKADFERRGFRVDPSVWTWTHPLGQALTGAYMRYTGRDGCHWCLG